MLKSKYPYCAVGCYSIQYSFASAEIIVPKRNVISCQLVAGNSALD